MAVNLEMFGRINNLSDHKWPRLRPFDCGFDLGFRNSKNPLDCDTFRAFKTSENSVTAGSEFSQLTIHPDEPCVLYSDAN